LGGNATGMQDLLSPAQQQAIRNQSMMAMAASLLRASGPSPQRTTLGQALGGAFEAGQGAMQAGQTNAVQQMLLGQKIQEARDAAASRQSFNQLLGGAPTTTAQALAAPAATAGPVGPTQQRAGMVGTSPNVTSTGAPSMLSMLTPEQRRLIAMQGPEKGAETLLRLSETPADIRAAEYLLGERLGGTGQRGVQAVGEYRSQIAPRTSTTVKNVLPAGPNQFVSGAGTAAAANLDAALSAAQGANSTLRNIDLIAPALDQAVLGPGADYRTAMLRVGSTLGITGENTDQVLQNTRQVVQGLARAELDAAAGMRGQGQITDSERAIIRRMSLGEQNMTAAELRTGMAAMQKLANERLQSYQGSLSRARQIPGFEAIAPMFEINPYQSQFNLGTNLNLGNAVQEELNRRRQGGR
jgi:hypothetical protein